MAFRAPRARFQRANNVVVRPPARCVIARAQDAVAAPYAQGIIELASERGILEAVYNDLMGLQAMISPSQDGKPNELRTFILGVPLNGERRKEVISSLAKEAGMQAETTDFLKLLVDTNRMDAIEDIISVFEGKYNELTETKIVTLRSAARLEQDQEFEIAKRLQEKTKSKNIKIKPIVDEALIGGFVIEYGDSRIDLSIRGHLDRIEAELTGNPVGAF